MAVEARSDRCFIGYIYCSIISIEGNTFASDAIGSKLLEGNSCLAILRTNLLWSVM